MAEEDISEQQPAVAMKFPREEDQYVLTAAIGRAEAATMYRAKHVNPTTGKEIPVGIKIVSMYQIDDIYTLTGEVHEAESCDHENLVKVHCSFRVKDQLWIIMPPLPRFSLRSFILSSFPDGLPENTVVFILRGVLKALNYMHGKNKLHQNVGADCIFLDEESRVKLAYHSLVYESNDHLNSSSNLSPISPELVMDYRKGNTKVTDIWMFGLLALELFYGRTPASDIDEFELLIGEIENELKRKENNRGILGSRFLGKLRFFKKQTKTKNKKKKKKKKKKISKALGEVIVACLSRDPRKRPTTSQLMESKLFQKGSLGQDSLEKLKRLTM